MTDAELNELKRLAAMTEADIKQPGAFSASIDDHAQHLDDLQVAIRQLLAEVRRLRAREKVGELFVRAMMARGLVAADEAGATLGIGEPYQLATDKKARQLVPHVARLRAAQQLAEAVLLAGIIETANPKHWPKLDAAEDAYRRARRAVQNEDGAP